MMFDKKNLLYRRQFILGPRYLDKFSHWRKRKIDNDLFLSVHPDLELNYVSNKNISLILLGFLLDPYNPEHSNIDILNGLIKDCSTFQGIVRGTNSLGGRWIIIYKDNESVKMFHDPAGDRQVFFSKHNSGIWSASQPHTIAEELNFQKSNDSDLIKFITSKVFHGSQNNWVGDSTLYDKVKHLMPNKFLDLKTGTVTRYWPDRKLKELSTMEAAKKAAIILKGLIESANNRYKLMLAVTSGLDTRTLLAASREISKDVFYFIQKFGDLDYNSNDIKVPLKLFTILDMEFNVIECEEKIDKEFNSILEENVSLVQTEEKKVLYYNFFKNFQGRLNVSGNAGGITRLWLGFEVAPHTAKEFTDFIWEGETFALKHIKVWFEEVKNFPSKFGVHLLNLFYWEHRIGNWCASFESDLDIAVEQLNPHNCRKFIELCLSVNAKDRKDPDCVLYKEMIMQLWPETLAVPVVPIEMREVVLYFILSFLKRVHLYNMLRFVFNGIKKVFNRGKC